MDYDITPLIDAFTKSAQQRVAADPFIQSGAAIQGVNLGQFDLDPWERVAASLAQGFVGGGLQEWGRRRVQEDINPMYADVISAFQNPNKVMGLTKYPEFTVPALQLGLQQQQARQNTLNTLQANSMNEYNKAILANPYNAERIAKAFKFPTSIGDAGAVEFGSLPGINVQVADTGSTPVVVTEQKALPMVEPKTIEPQKPLQAALEKYDGDIELARKEVSKEIDTTADLRKDFIKELNGDAKQAREEYQAATEVYNASLKAEGYNQWGGSIGDAGSYVGYDKEGASARSRVKGYFDKIARGERKPGEGTFSEGDQRVLSGIAQAGVVDQQTAIKFSRAMQLNAENKMEFSRVAQDLLDKGVRQTDIQAMYKAYLDADPIFQPGTTELNQNRKGVREFFKESAPSLEQIESQALKLTRQQYQEGQTATNSKGEKLVYQNGKWRSM